MPDYLAISVGDGCTIAGVWKGLKDLYAIGFIDKLPRLISAQAEGCHPINRAIAENKPWEPMEENTLADSIAVGVPRNADKALMAIRESNGIVVNVTDEEIMAAQKLLGTTCGVFGEPAGVTGTAAVKKLCEQGVLGENDTVVSVVTGNGLKDVANAIKFCGEPMSLHNRKRRAPRTRRFAGPFLYKVLIYDRDAVQQGGDRRGSCEHENREQRHGEKGVA